MKLLYQKYVALLALLLVTACASLAKPETFDQRLAYYYGTNTAYLEAATSSLSAKTISSADHAEVIERHRRVRTFLDAARNASDLGDVVKAENQILLAVAALSSLQDYLRSKNVQAPVLKVGG